VDTLISKRVSSPDVGVFIYSGLKTDTYCKKYFKDLESNRITNAVLLETVHKRLLYWLQKMMPTLNSFYNHCREKGMKPEIYLKHVRSRVDADRRMKDFNKYSNVIEKTLNLKMDASKRFELYLELKRYFDSLLIIFAKRPNQILFDKIEETYILDILKELKDCTNNKFDDKEDAEHIASLNYFLYEKNNSGPIFFITMDKALRKFSENILEWNKWIYVVSPDEYYDGLPEFIKQAK